MARPKTIITKSELAGILGLSRGRISQVSKREDFPLRPDGKINRDEAVRWYKNLGLADRPKRGPKPKLQAAPVTEQPEPDAGLVPEKTTLEQVSELCRQAYRDGQLRTIEGLARPANMLVIGELASAVGCSLQQAITLAHLYRLMLVAWSLDDNERIETEDPHWETLAARIGESVTPAEIKTWLAASGPALDAWYKAHPDRKRRPPKKAQAAK